MGTKIFSVLFFIVLLGGVVYFFRSTGLFEKSSDFLEDLQFGPPRLSTSTEKEERQAAPQKVVQKEKPAVLEQESAVNQQSIPEGFTASDLSPHFKKIDLLASRSRITLRANFSGSGGISFAGWVLQSKRGSLPLPGAVNIYEPSGLSPAGDIILRNGETLKIHNGQSAVGINFRLNKCIGYLENTNDFSPSLPRSCPNPASDFDLSRVTGECEDYIESLGSCRLPKANPPVPSTDYACRQYLDQINMRGCYERHRFDSDFLSKERWAWANLGFLDSRHDRVVLFDGERKVVDVYEY